jgi:hypothetical protein
MMVAPAGALLIVQSGIPTPGAIPLDEGMHVLGRIPIADIDFDNPFVSRRHAEISFNESGYSIRDLGSKNGTFVDGVRISEHPRALSGGEIVELGEGQVVATFALKAGTVTLPHAGASVGMAAAAPSGTLNAAASGGLTVDLSKREVYMAGTPVVPPLTRKEFDILELLWERRGEACSKDEISARGWPERPRGSVTDQEISQCVHRIRKRVEPDPGAPRYVELMRGFGYRLNPLG